MKQLIKQITDYLKRIFEKKPPVQKEPEIYYTAGIEHQIKEFYRKDKHDNDISH